MAGNMEFDADTKTDRAHVDLSLEVITTVSHLL